MEQYTADVRRLPFGEHRGVPMSITRQIRKGSSLVWLSIRFHVNGQEFVLTPNKLNGDNHQVLRRQVCEFIDAALDDYDRIDDAFESVVVYHQGSIGVLLNRKAKI